MIWILLGGVFFVGIHLLVAGTGVRDKLVGKLGEQGYLALFSLLSLGGISWLCTAWARSEVAAPWWDWTALRPLAWILMFFSFQLVVVGLTTKSPTAAGGEAVLGSDEPATGILRISRHPFLWGVALWGLCHLLVNPDGPAFLFFGALLSLALLGPRSIDAKRARKHGEDWQRFASRTSNLPFAAIAAGRNRLVVSELGWWRIAVAATLYVVFLVWLHPLLFTAPAL
jgi:uncharacterized membrane protein